MQVTKHVEHVCPFEDTLLSDFIRNVRRVMEIVELARGFALCVDANSEAVCSEIADRSVVK